MTNENIEFRSATEADLPALTELQSQLTQSSLEVAIPIFRKMAQYPNYKIYLAFIEERLVGTFTLMIMDNLGHGGAPIAIIENVVIHFKLRRQGLGRHMMNFAVQKSRESGCYKMSLASNIKLSQAHQFYESLDFTKQGFVFSLDL
jgi:GNAT superfamily N-acetyltransferase